MLDNETVKTKLFEMLEECNELLCKYKDLRARGMSKSEDFEAVWNTRKQTISEILDIILK